MPRKESFLRETPALANRVWAPVRRSGASGLLLLTLLSFAVTVGGTRLLLTITGYPRLGGESLHIAHVLWGGLVLFAAALLMLIFANRWAYQAGSVLAGVGMGLFIDEVGKFLTATNDYFFPAAAPIVYAVFLMIVLLYLQIRRRSSGDARQELYTALEEFEGLLDGDLDPRERQALVSRLARAEREAETRDLRRLARSLKEFASDAGLQLSRRRVGRVDAWIVRFRRWESRSFQRPWFRAALAGALAALGLLAWKNPAGTFLVQGAALAGGHIGRRIEVAGSPAFLARVLLEILGGILLLAGAALLAAGRDRPAVATGLTGILLMLTVANLLVFYYEQFSTMLTAGLQFLALLGLLRYRRRFLSGAAPGLKAETAGGSSG
jgi:hypothetical protein